MQEKLRMRNSHGLFWKQRGQWKWFCLKLRAELMWLDWNFSGAFFSPIFLFPMGLHCTAGGGLQHGLGTADSGLWDP